MPLYNPIPVSGSATGSTSAPTTTSASYVLMPEMTLTLVGSGGPMSIDFTGSFNVQNGDDFTLGLYMDSSLVTGVEQRVAFFGGSLLGLTPASITSAPFSLTALVPASAGSHIYEIRWKVAGGTARAITTQRKLTIKEIL